MLVLRVNFSSYKFLMENQWTLYFEVNCLLIFFFLIFKHRCLQNFFPAMTKIVGTLGPKSRTVEIISGCLKAGMSGILSASLISVLFPGQKLLFELLDCFNSSIARILLRFSVNLSKVFVVICFGLQ